MKDQVPVSQDQFCDLPSGIRLCFRVHGPDHGRPLVLVAGLGLQLTSWSPNLVQRFCELGYRVVTFDNRDVGKSSRIEIRPPTFGAIFLKRFHRELYDLSDMSNDVIGLMDYLGIQHAHLVGMSMGGMIAQTVAASHPHRVHSLTSIFSTTGAKGVGNIERRAFFKLIQRPPRNQQEAVRRFVSFVRYIGSTAYEMDDTALSRETSAAWERGAGETAHEGVARQMGAILKSGDRTQQVRTIRSHTLVIHGDQDRMVHPSGGAATAAAVPGAKLIQICGMGHYLPEGANPYLVDLIHGHASRSISLAERSSAERKQEQ